MVVEVEAAGSDRGTGEDFDRHEADNLLYLLRGTYKRALARFASLRTGSWRRPAVQTFPGLRAEVRLLREETQKIARKNKVLFSQRS